MPKRIDYSDTGDGTIAYSLQNDDLSGLTAFSAAQDAELNSELLDEALITQGNADTIAFNFPSVLSLSTVYVCARLLASPVTDCELSWSSDSTNGVDGSWNLELFTWSGTSAKPHVLSMTITGAPVSSTWVRIRWKNGGTYIAQPQNNWHTVHVFGDYLEANVNAAIYLTDEVTPITANYIDFGTAVRGDAIVNLTATFKLKNMIASTKSFTLATDDIRYASETQLTDLFTFSDDGASTSSATITVTCDPSAFSPEILWQISIGAGDFDQMTQGLHYMKVLPTML